MAARLAARALSLSRPRPSAYPSSSYYSSSASPLSTRRPPASTRSFFDLAALLHSNVATANAALTGIHALTGLPWVVSIPLTALVVRTAVLPLQLFVLWQRDRRAVVAPYLVAVGRVLQQRTVTESARKNRRLSPALLEASTQTTLRAARRDQRLRLAILPGAPAVMLLQLPAWLAVMEALRRMVGVDGGVLTLLLQTIGDPSAPAFADIAVEPSMADGGALWFPNLLAADPYGLLPCLLASVMFANVTLGWPKPGAGTTSTAPGGSSLDPAVMPVYAARRARMMRGLRRACQLIALSLAPSTIAASVPAGLLVYWIASSAMATAQTRLLARLWPPPRLPHVCRNLGVASTRPLDFRTVYQVGELTPAAVAAMPVRPAAASSPSLSSSSSLPSSSSSSTTRLRQFKRPGMSK